MGILSPKGKSRKKSQPSKDAETKTTGRNAKSSTTNPLHVTNGPKSPIASAKKGTIRKRATSLQGGRRSKIVRTLASDTEFSQATGSAEKLEKPATEASKEKLFSRATYREKDNEKEESKQTEDQEKMEYVDKRRATAGYFDPYLFIKSLQAKPRMKHKQAALPKKTRQAPPVTLVLDLDETLVHCSTSLIPKYELKFIVEFGGINHQVYVRRRPHLIEFLKSVSEWFEVVIFTASQKVYADKLLNIIDPQRKYIRHRLFQESCVVIDGNYVKDLNILGRPLERCAIIDNSPQAFGFQLDNGIPIESWFDNENDRELLNMIPFLKTIKDAKDVRPLVRKRFRMKEYIDSL